VHAPDLVARSINAMRNARAQMFTIAGRQELGGFWEKVMQPQIFTILAMRYGGTESITRAANVRDKIANGQCIFVTHDSYNAIGGHASVRTSVAEDMMLAQKFFAARKRVVVMLGLDQLSTRMYGSLREIIAGWRKNVYAGGLDAVPFGRVGETLFPLFLLTPPMMQLLPLLALACAAVGLATSGALLLWASISTAATLLWWILVYVTIREKPLYALAYPLGALVLLYIFFTAVVRGRRVSWKGRTYISR
jgi:chlorobactene glucosyltransferase